MKKNTIFTGAGVAIITPMNHDGSVNFDKLGKFIDFQIENSTDAIVICGTTGEGATLTHEEHSKAIKYTAEYVNGRVPVIAGTGSNDTEYAVKLSNEAEKDGVDALLMVTPYYNKTSQAGLVAHYSYINDRVSTPIILYNVPSRTGVDIKPETYKELSKLKNIVAAKEANGNISALMQTMSLCGDELDIYSGNDDQIAPFTAMGGKGVISVLSNVAPKITHEMAQAGVDGDVKKSTALQLEYLKLCNNLFCDVNPIPVKEALNMMGWDVGPCRLPLTALNEANRQKLENTMKKYKLI